MIVDEAKRDLLLGKLVQELGAAASASLVVVGDELGLFRALGDAGALDSEELARHTGTSERYVREWLATMAASGWIEYDAATERFRLSPEQRLAFADPQGPSDMTGGFWSVLAVYRDLPRVIEAFRTGAGISWNERDECLFCGTARFYGPSYRTQLVQSWIPALEGVVEKLERGASVADLGCGHGISTITMAEAFPRSRFVGFDPHPASIEAARTHAAERGVTNVAFELADAKRFAGRGYDLVACFDCLHDMGDPVGAAKRVRAALAPDGTWLVVEPFAHDELAANLNPVGRTYFAFSTTVCTPASLSQEVGLALGAQAGEARLRELIGAGGFTRVRRAAETPFNLVLEARP